MDVFELRGRLVEDYARYTRSFIKIADPRIDQKVARALEAGVVAGAVAAAQSHVSAGRHDR